MNPRGKRSEIRLLGAANDDSVRSEVIRDAVFEHLRELGEGFALVADCLQTLGAQRDRYVLEGYWVGLSIRQMAKVLGVTPQAVRFRLRKQGVEPRGTSRELTRDERRAQLRALEGYA
jgi:DNA-directed RNA polymerase specialized sigma24 family protein